MIPISQDAFTIPSESDFDSNYSYYSGYLVIVSNPPVFPSFNGVADYPGWRALTDRMMQNPVTDVITDGMPRRVVNSFIVGKNAAIVDAANWLYHNDPNSPFKKAV